jgi:putative membrane protein insertion efficiency factor
MGMTRPSWLTLIARAPRLAGRGLIGAYRYTLSPLVGFHCRHLPTCSQYGDEALDRFGLWAGGWMTLARLLRCHPWGTSGLDLVPPSRPAGAHWYLPWRYARWHGTNRAIEIAGKLDVATRPQPPVPPEPNNF